MCGSNISELLRLRGEMLGGRAPDDKTATEVIRQYQSIISLAYDTALTCLSVSGPAIFINEADAVFGIRLLTHCHHHDTMVMMKGTQEISLREDAGGLALTLEAQSALKRL